MSFVPSTGALVPVTEAYIKTSMRICSPEILEKRLRKLKVVTSCYCPSLEKKKHNFINLYKLLMLMQRITLTTAIKKQFIYKKNSTETFANITNKKSCNPNNHK